MNRRRFSFVLWWNIVQMATIFTINLGFRGGRPMPLPMLFIVEALCAGFAFITTPLFQRFCWGINVWIRVCRKLWEEDE